MGDPMVSGSRLVSILPASLLIPLPAHLGKHDTMVMVPIILYLTYNLNSTFFDHFPLF